MAPIENIAINRERAVIILSRAIKLLSGSIDPDSDIDADCAAESTNELAELRSQLMKH
ncbi:hypothetical protein [Vibrio albus]|uniref:hypothetical protein n=1 Tax=Vibrio albus TaxID=2200953 RepID=UPI0015E830E8|nr:hypothetical protein [Vibrio albus]